MPPTVDDTPRTGNLVLAEGDSALLIEQAVQGFRLGARTRQSAPFVATPVQGLTKCHAVGPML